LYDTPKTILDVVRGDDRWLFVFEDGVVGFSNTFLGPLALTGTPSVDLGYRDMPPNSRYPCRAIQEHVASRPGSPQPPDGQVFPVGSTGPDGSARSIRPDGRTCGVDERSQAFLIDDADEMHQFRVPGGAALDDVTTSGGECLFVSADGPVCRPEPSSSLCEAADVAERYTCLDRQPDALRDIDQSFILHFGGSPPNGNFIHDGEHIAVSFFHGTHVGVWRTSDAEEVFFGAVDPYLGTRDWGSRWLWLQRGNGHGPVVTVSEGPQAPRSRLDIPPSAFGGLWPDQRGRFVAWMEGEAAVVFDEPARGRSTLAEHGQTLLGWCGPQLLTLSRDRAVMRYDPAHQTSHRLNLQHPASQALVSVDRAWVASLGADGCVLSVGSGGSQYWAPLVQFSDEPISMRRAACDGELKVDCVDRDRCLLDCGSAGLFWTLDSGRSVYPVQANVQPPPPCRRSRWGLAPGVNGNTTGDSIHCLAWGCVAGNVVRMDGW